MALDKNTKITLGGAVVIATAMVSAAVQLHELKAEVRSCWTVEDQQNWADWARKNNPSINVPSPQEIRRMKRGAVLGESMVKMK